MELGKERPRGGQDGPSLIPQEGGDGHSTQALGFQAGSRPGERIYESSSSQSPSFTLDAKKVGTTEFLSQVFPALQ